MNQSLYGKKGNAQTSNQNVPFLQNLKVLTNEISSKESNNTFSNTSSIFLKPAQSSNREFGKELKGSTNQNATNITRRDVGSSKPVSFFDPSKREKGAQKKKNEISLYNLRPRVSSVNTSMNSLMMSNSVPHNDENVNSMNTNMRVEVKRRENSEMDVEMSSEAEKSNTVDLTDLSYKPSQSSQNSVNLAQIHPVKCPQHVAEYLEEIYHYLKSVEGNLLPAGNYMINQKDINEKMRAILVDWLVDVHLKFKLRAETIFLATHILDRFLEKVDTPRNKLQLVGVASLFIACKYEEIYPPELKDFVYITDKAYSREDILQMEKEILTQLEFSVTHPSSLRFFEIFVELSSVNFGEEALLFAGYLLELFLVEYRMVKYPPSLIAAATLYITVRIKKIYSLSKSDITQLTGYSEDKLKDCAKDICVVLDNVERSQLQAVKNKYSSTKFLEVSKWTH